MACVVYACTDRLYSLCNAFNDNVHHFGWQSNAVSVVCNQECTGHTHAQTDYNSLQVICIASSEGKGRLPLNIHLHGKPTSVKA